MPKKKESHTGFRNGDLFCFNCGTAYKMNLPQPTRMAAAMMIQFGKDHANCPKTWVESVNEPEAKTEEQNADWWLKNGEQGISSKTMFFYLSGRKFKLVDYESTPSDPDDFKRCYLLIKAVPQFRDKLHLLKSVNQTWSNIVDNWGKLTEMYEENVRTAWKNYKKIGMYEFMKSIGC